MTRLILLLSLSIALSACGQPQIDCSDPDPPGCRKVSCSESHITFACP